MGNESIVNEYFKNPFFLWSVSVTVLTKLNSAFIISKLLEDIWVKQIYIFIIFPSLFIAIVLMTYPIRRGFIDFVKIKENKITGIIFILAIMMIVWLEATLSFVEVYQIMSVQIPEAVVNKKQFDYAINQKDLMVFLAIPIITFVLLHNMKSELRKKGFPYEDGFRSNLKFILSGIVCSVVITGIAGLILWR